MLLKRNSSPSTNRRACSLCLCCFTNVLFNFQILVYLLRQKKVSFYTAVIFSHLYIPWIKNFNIIAVTPNSWLVSSEHFHLHIEWVLYLLSCKCIIITAVVKVFSLSYYSWFHSIRFYVLRKVDKYAFMSFIREL